MQAASDIFLGWQRVTGLDGQAARLLPAPAARLEGLGRRRHHGADADGRCTPGSARRTLARAHARSGDRIAIASYLGNSDAFDRAIADFASAYADQNERDYQAMADAVTSGRLEAQTGL